MPRRTASRIVTTLLSDFDIFSAPIAQRTGVDPQVRRTEPRPLANRAPLRSARSRSRGAGKIEVGAAAVDVEVLAQQFARHGRALDVPAGAAGAPARLPLRLAGLGALPQHEVERIALAAVDGDALAGAQFVEAAARRACRSPASCAPQSSRRRRRRHHYGLVGEVLLLEQVDDVEHLRHVLGGARLGVRRRDAEVSKILAASPG